MDELVIEKVTGTILQALGVPPAAADQLAEWFSILTVLGGIGKFFLGMTQAAVQVHAAVKQNHQSPGLTTRTAVRQAAERFFAYPAVALFQVAKASWQNFKTTVTTIGINLQNRHLAQDATFTQFEGLDIPGNQAQQQRTLRKLFNRALRSAGSLSVAEFMDSTRLNDQLAALGLEMGDRCWEMVWNGDLVLTTALDMSMAEFLRTHPTVEFRDPTISFENLDILTDNKLNQHIENVWEITGNFDNNFIDDLKSELLEIKTYLLNQIYQKQNDYNGLTLNTFLPYLSEFQNFLENDPISQISDIFDDINLELAKIGTIGQISSVKKEVFSKFICQYLLVAFRSIPQSGNMEIKYLKGMTRDLGLSNLEESALSDFIYNKVYNYQYSFKPQKFLEFLREELPKNIYHIQLRKLDYGIIKYTDEIIDEYMETKTTDSGVEYQNGFGLLAEFLFQESLKNNNIFFETGTSLEDKYQIISENNDQEIDILIETKIGNKEAILILEIKSSVFSIPNLRGLMKKDYDKLVNLREVLTNRFPNKLILSMGVEIFIPFVPFDPTVEISPIYSSNPLNSNFNRIPDIINLIIGGRTR